MDIETGAGFELPREDASRADAAREDASRADFERKYSAISTRDVRFDGQFFTAVKTTGIYCRPSCPARTPKPENVTFFSTSAAAHEAGFRACKRCLPEATAGTPEWNIRQDVTARAMRLIGDGVVDREGVGGLAAHLGFTPRHLNRLLSHELGAGPLALARARRANIARALLADSDLPISDVAFASGFKSVRQFNETFAQVFQRSPSAIRASRSAADQRVSSSRVRLTLVLQVREPFDALGVVSFLAARAINGVERAEIVSADHLVYARTMHLPHGPGAFEATFTRLKSPRPRWHIEATVEASVLADVSPAVARIRRLFDLDADSQGIDGALGSDPYLAPVVQHTPGIRVPGTVDPHELVIRAIVGQQISVMAARGHLTRLCTQLGTPYESDIDGLSLLVPTAAQIADNLAVVGLTDPLDPKRPLRLPRRSINTVVSTAQALASGELRVDVGTDLETLTRDLVARPGIGQWTAAYVALRVLGATDSWMISDVALIAGGKALGLIPQDLNAKSAHRFLHDYAAQWSPWCSYASMHLWQAAATGSPAHAPSTTDQGSPL